MFYFLFIPEGYFHWICNAGLTITFYQHMENTVPLTAFCFSWFRIRNLLLFEFSRCFFLSFIFIFSSLGNALLLFSRFRGFCSVFGFRMVNHHVSWCGFGVYLVWDLLSFSKLQFHVRWWLGRRAAMIPPNASSALPLLRPVWNRSDVEGTPSATVLLSAGLSSGLASPNASYCLLSESRRNRFLHSA